MKTVPNYSETRIIHGLYGEVIIDRSDKGIPEIKASCIEDVFFALGYIHAMDRLWQLEVLRRSAQGTLSEIFGASALKKDILARNMQFKQNAFKLFSLSSKAELYLHRYCEGINNYAESNYLPIEFFITWQKWKKWDSIDTLSIWRYISFALATDWDNDLLKSEVLSKLKNWSIFSKNSQFQQYFTIDNNELPRELYKRTENMRTHDFEVFGIKSDDLHSYQPFGTCFVVSGDYTITGKPILSSSLSSNFDIPSLFYLTSVKWNKFSIKGGTIPGLPIFVFGTNGIASWASNPLKTDTIDLYSQKVDKNSYFYQNSWVDLQTFTETIRVKNEPDRIIQFFVTNAGPLLHGFSDNISIKWAADEVFDTSLDSFIDLMTATTVRSIRISLEKVVIPNLGIVFANTEGEIGFQAVGVHPIRNYEGFGVLNGENDLTKWKAFVKFEDLPYCLNPSKGFIVFANNRVSTELYSHFEAFDGAFDGIRASRLDFLIRKKMNSAKKLKTYDFFEVLYDEYSDIAYNLLPVWLKILENKYADRVFNDWDYVVKGSSYEAAIFETWLFKVIENLNSKLTKSQYFINFVIKSFVKDLDFCEKIKTIKENCKSLLESTFDLAISESAGKNWEDLHISYYKHSLLSWFPYISYFSDIKRPIGGSFSTINSYPFNKTQGFVSFFGVSSRFLIDLGNESQSRWGINSGQSGNLLSPHYSNQNLNFIKQNLEPLTIIPKYETRLRNK